MKQAFTRCLIFAGAFWVVLLASGCSWPKPWPASPLYPLPVDDPAWEGPANRAEAIAAMAGHYAHFDVVAYAEDMPTGPFYTFVISYGFTDLVVEDGQLVEYDSFCHAEHEANQNMTTTFPDAATQAIQPRSTVVEVFEEDGAWKLYRPPTPTLIGVDGDPDQPLSMNRDNPNLTDADGDGKPGVTVFLKLFGFLRGELYIARREVFENCVTLYSDGSLRGTVVDRSEQLVIDASLRILRKPSNPAQWDDPGLNPLILIPIPDDVDTCEELMALRDTLFPEAPRF